MRIFIAGATGVVGRRVVRLLVEAGHDVTAVSRSKSVELLEAGATPVEVDLFDPAAIAEAAQRQDVIVNLATRIPPSDKMLLPWAWKENDRLRSEASWNLARAAVACGVGRLVQESVIFGYADGGEEWLDESALWEPLRHVRSATEAERAARHVTEQGGVGVVLRFALFYGPDSGHTLDTIELARKGIAASFGPADGFMSSITTDDAASAVVAALSAPAGVYNVADDEPVRRSEYFAALGAALERKRPWIAPAKTAALTGSVGKSVARSHRISNRRFAEATGWRPATPSVREGWSRVVEAIGSE